MSESERFLSRWARRKHEAAKPAAAREADDAPATADAAPQGDARAAPSVPKSETGEPATFDPASLPPLDSIVAGTDIRAFLARGVPAELTRAALRRAWAADPAIRDFIGLSENSWDFTAPEGVPGFGPMRPSDNMHELLARVGGQGHELVPESGTGGESSLPNLEGADSRGAAPVSPHRDERAQGPHEPVKLEGDTEGDRRKTVEQPAGLEAANIVNKNEDVASQDSSKPSELSAITRRRGQGGALPR